MFYVQRRLIVNVGKRDVYLATWLVAAQEATLLVDGQFDWCSLRDTLQLLGLSVDFQLERLVELWKLKGIKCNKKSYLDVYPDCPFCKQFASFRFGAPRVGTENQM